MIDRPAPASGKAPTFMPAKQNNNGRGLALSAIVVTLLEDKLASLSEADRALFKDRMLTNVDHEVEELAQAIGQDPAKAAFALIREQAAEIVAAHHEAAVAEIKK